MSEFNRLLNSRFRGCPQIAEFSDPHRGRTVRAFDIGEDLEIGLYDGVDVWIAHAESSMRSPNLKLALDRHRSGVTTHDSALPLRKIRRVLLNG